MGSACQGAASRKVYHIGYASSAMDHDPVVSIEGYSRGRRTCSYRAHKSETAERYVPEEVRDPRLWAGLPWSALEADQTNASTTLPATSCLPLVDVRPRALIHGVVDGYDDLHVQRAGIVVLACHGHVELRLGGVHPVFLVAARDGGDLARGRE